MIIGIDLDNTIVAHDRLFHSVALRKKLVAADFPVSKSKLRDLLRVKGGEHIWIDLQGTVYGEGMKEAEAFPGVREFIKKRILVGDRVYIISHRTLRPANGAEIDLHKSARDWLEQQGFFDKDDIGMPPRDVYLEITREKKIERIASCKCTHFIDDLPEVLQEPLFPGGTAKMLFDPDGKYRAGIPCLTFNSWRSIDEYFS